jgi:tRNA A-37 threonylcarbamoyl transferase component Bud32
LLPRDLGDTRPFGNLRRAVEHEALASLTAGSFGVRTPAVVALCDAEPGGVVLAYKAVAGRSLDRVDDDKIDDDIVAGVWAQLTLLRAHRLAHRDLRLANMFLDDAGTVWLIDFGFAELAASDLLLATDLAELTASLALKVGPARAAAAATAAVGHDAVATALPRLQPGFLSGATRTALAQQPQMLEDIRAALGDGETGR